MCARFSPTPNGWKSFQDRVTFDDVERMLYGHDIAAMPSLTSDRLPAEETSITLSYILTNRGGSVSPARLCVSSPPLIAVRIRKC
jgi:hypothetical protein